MKRLCTLLWVWIGLCSLAGYASGQITDIDTPKLFTLPATNHGVFYRGATVTISNINGGTMTVRDLRSNVVWSTASAVASRAFTTNGHYFVTNSNAGTNDFTQFCVLPSDYGTLSVLGDFADDDDGDLNKRQRRWRLGVTWLRTSESNFKDTRPASTTTNMAYVDGTVTNNPGMKFIFCLNSPPGFPAWATTNDYTAYIAFLLARYPGKTAAVEPFNEPGAELTNHLSTIFTVTRNTVRGITNGCLVFAPSWPQETMGFVYNPRIPGLSTNADGVSFHHYGGDRVAVDSNGQSIVELVATNLAFGSTNKVAITELGLYANSPAGLTYHDTDHSVQAPTWRIGASRAQKFAVMFAPYATNLIPHVLTSATTTGDVNYAAAAGWEAGFRGPQPKVSAFVAALNLLKNCTAPSYTTAGIYRIATFTRSTGRPLIVVWTQEGTNSTIKTVFSTLTRSFYIHDVYGNLTNLTTLSDEPMWLTTTKAL